MLAKLEWLPERPDRPKTPPLFFMDETLLFVLTLVAGTTLIAGGIIAMWIS